MAYIEEEIIERIAGHLSDLDCGQRRRLVMDARQYAFGVFQRPNPPRPTASLKELEAVQNCLANLLGDLNRVSYHTWPYLHVAEDHEKDELVAPVLCLQERVDEAVMLAKDWVEETNDRRGGRTSDRRVCSCVGALAALYRRYLRKEITHSVSPADGSLTSDFDRFVVECFRAFYPGDEVPHSAVEKTIRGIRSPQRRRAN